MMEHLLAVPEEEEEEEEGGGGLLLLQLQPQWQLQGEPQ
jgi:hypothetical protein